MNANTSLLTTGLVASLLFAGAAVANDAKIFNGSDCSFTDSSQTTGMDRTFARLQNIAGSTEQIVCPLIRDSLGSDIESVWILASNAMDESTCRLRERRSDGDTGTWTNNATDPEGTDNTKTWWFKGSSEGALADDNASLAILCDLPDDAQVNTYYIKED